MKPKKCKQCGKPFVQTYSTLQKVCGTKCAIAYNKAKEEERFKKAEEAVNGDKKFMALRELAKKQAQKYARLRDKNLPCISCGTTKAEEWHGGHLFKAELYSGVLLDEINISKQCKKCNKFMDGNEAQYVIGFVKRYGQEAFNDLAAKAKATKNKKWTRDELAEKIEYYKQLNKTL